MFPILKFCVTGLHQYLPIMCPPHPPLFPFLLSKMTFYYLSFYINPIIDTVLHKIILQILCYILL